MIFTCLHLKDELGTGYTTKANPDLRLDRATLNVVYRSILTLNFLHFVILGFRLRIRNTVFVALVGLLNDTDTKLEPLGRGSCRIIICANLLINSVFKLAKVLPKLCREVLPFWKSMHAHL